MPLVEGPGAADKKQRDESGEHAQRQSSCCDTAARTAHPPRAGTTEHANDHSGDSGQAADADPTGRDTEQAQCQGQTAKVVPGSARMINMRMPILGRPRVVAGGGARPWFLRHYHGRPSQLRQRAS